MSIPVLKIKDENGNVISVPAIKGDPGKDGSDYVLTDTDKQEIADMVDIPIDKNFKFDSENAQSGKAVAEAVSASANAIKGTVYGESVEINDVSPVEHNVTGMVYGETSSFDPTTATITVTESGESCTPNTDGTFTVKSTSPTMTISVNAEPNIQEVDFGNNFYMAGSPPPAGTHECELISKEEEHGILHFDCTDLYTPLPMEQFLLDAKYIMTAHFDPEQGDIIDSVIGVFDLTETPSIEVEYSKDTSKAIEEAIEEAVASIDVGGGSAISEDGTLLLDNGLTIRSTQIVDESTGEKAPSWNYVKVGKDLDGDALLSFQGWDFAGSIEQSGFHLYSPRDNTGVYFNAMSGEGGTADIDAGTVNINSYGKGIKLNCVDAVLNRDEYTITQPNSIATIGYVDSVVSGGGSGGSSDVDLDTKANLEFVSIPSSSLNILAVPDGTVGAEITTLKSIYSSTFPFESGLMQYEVNFSNGWVLGETMTEADFNSIGLVEGDTYRITVNNYSINKLEKVIDLKDKVNKEDIGSKVLLDVTLTEEQAGASSIMLEIPDWQLLKKAKQWNFFLSHPYSGAYAQGAINYRADVKDKDGRAYGFPIGYESNSAYSADYNVATWHTVTFNLCFDDGLGEIMTIQNKPTCWARVSAYNTLNNARVTNSSRKFNYVISEGYPPYLEVKNSSDFIFEAGTRIYLEVTL